MSKCDDFAAKTVLKMQERASLRAAAAAARARWDADHLTKMQCNVSNEEAEQIDRLCSSLGCSRYSLVKALLMAAIDQAPTPADDTEADLWQIQDAACEILDLTAQLLHADR
nr:unnamed protein product [uncultured bacterium]